MPEERIESTSLLLLHALISMGHPLTEKTVDDAIALAELHAKKCDARRPEPEVVPDPTPKAEMASSAAAPAPTAVEVPASPVVPAPAAAPAPEAPKPT